MSIDKARVRSVLKAAYEDASEIESEVAANTLEADLGPDLHGLIQKIASTKHAGRGVMLTLLAVKASDAAVDTRYNKTEHGLEGWSARTVDTDVTVPFLNDHQLHASAESHWLTQAFSLGTEPWLEDMTLNIKPKHLGVAMIQFLNKLETIYAEGLPVDDPSPADSAVRVLLLGLIDERNRGRVSLQRPKNRTVEQVLALLVEHTSRPYKHNAPRLPQLMVYALYKCMMDNMLRYTDCSLDNLQKMKAADRKAGTVGDIVVSRNDSPFEAVETKLDRPIDLATVVTATEKVKTAAVERYLILSTAGTAEHEEDAILRKCREFRSSNGCEIIVASLFDVVRRYLELLPSTNEFIHEYCSLVEGDSDLGYEHREAWNDICSAAP